jgi:NAD+ synthetase
MKDGFIKVAAVSPELRVANTEFNGNKIISLVKKAEKEGVKILAFPELSLTGYTSGDLFFQKKLQDSVREEIAHIAVETETLSIAFAIGAPLVVGAKLYNTAVLINRGHVVAVVPKTNLPSYQEFYERRWFTPAPENGSYITLNGEEVCFDKNAVIRVKGMESARLGIEICEDLWVPESPSVNLAKSGATIILNLSCSDEIVGKAAYRRNLVSVQSGKLISAYVYADASSHESSTDMVFASHNLIAENGTILAEKSYKTDEFTISEIDTERLEAERIKTTTYFTETPTDSLPEVDVGYTETGLTRAVSAFPFVPSGKSERESRAEEILNLQALGLEKRLRHTHAKTAVVGLSGGLDSTLALLVTVEAFRKAELPLTSIIAVTMPCFGTTKRTRSNAETLALALGVAFREVDIRESVLSHFKDIGQEENRLDVTYENSQARERTQVLMDLANKEGGLVIGTGDLSELALGWATYNGDHMSMYAVNASVPKTLVRHLVAHYAKEQGGVIEKVLCDILDTPVSPELLPAKADGTISQVTEDLVGPYELHDFFIYYAVRFGFAPKKIYRLAKYAFNGKFDDAFIKKWLISFYKRFFAQQFKRSCLPDGPKVGSVTFSPRSDWRMPSDAEGRIWIEEAESL